MAEVIVHVSVPITVRRYPVPDEDMGTVLRLAMRVMRHLVADGEAIAAIDRIEEWEY